VVETVSRGIECGNHCDDLNPVIVRVKVLPNAVVARRAYLYEVAKSKTSTA
jgi:hypothetical protein